MDDTKLKVMWIGRFYFRWYAARALAPLMILTGWRFSWNHRASQKWRHKLLRYFVDVTQANRFAGTKNGGPGTPWA